MKNVKKILRRLIVYIEKFEINNGCYFKLIIQPPNLSSNL